MDWRETPPPFLSGRRLDAAVADEVFGAEVETWDGPDRTHYAVGAESPGTLTVRDEVSEEVLHRFSDGSEAIPAFSQDIGAAWRVHQVACDTIFSKRRKYLDLVRTMVTERVGSDGLVSFEGVLHLLEPEDLCRAAVQLARDEDDEDGGE